MFEATKIIHQNNDWITIVIIVIFIVLTLVSLLFKERLSHGNTFFLSKKNSSIYFNKGKAKLLNLFQIALFIVQLLVLSLLLYLANLYFQVHIQSLNFESYILIFCSVGIYFLLRYLIGLFVAFLFNFNSQHSKIVNDKINYFNNVVLWILPLLILSIYATKHQKIFLEITFVVFVSLLTLRYCLILVNNKKVIFNNFFYFILYLCALEIAPLIIVLKLTI